MFDHIELRDLIAALVLQGKYANPNHTGNTNYIDAEEAYAQADAALMIRKQKSE